MRQKGTLLKSVQNFFRSAWKDLLTAAVLMAAVSLLLFYWLELGSNDLSIPISYGGGDEFSVINTARLVMDCGWNTGTDRLAATDDYYYNNNEIISGLHNADIVCIKFFLAVTGNHPIKAANLTYLAAFYLIAGTSYLVFRLLKLQKWLSFAGALAYAFLAFIFMRGMGHLNLSCYYFVPFGVLMAMWVYEDKNFMRIRKGFFHDRRNWGGLVMAFLIATQGIGYWQVFACFCILVAAAAGFIRTKDWSYVNRGFGAIAAIVAAVFVNCIPVFCTMLSKGALSPASRYRGGTEGEAYGLKIVQLFLPVNGHGIDFWQECLDLYNEHMPLVNENRTAYIGLVGAVGFLILTFWLFTNRKDNTILRKRLTVLADMNICCVLLATVGGIGSMLYLAGFQILRSYNRISVYIAFLCITAFCLTAQYAQERFQKKAVRTAYKAAVFGCMLFAVWEQNPGYRLNTEVNKVNWNSEAAFVADIEAVLEEDAKILQLPYVSFPEDEAHYEMGPLAHLSGYFHSDKLRWSFATVYGSPSDLWYQETASLPAAEMVAQAREKGFSGIYIDRRGYAKEEAAQLEAQLTEYLGREPIVCSRGVLSFFKIAE